MKKALLVLASGLLLASCTQPKHYQVNSLIFGLDSVETTESLFKGDTVRIGYDLSGKHIASKDLTGNYIGHIAVVQ